MSCTMTLVITGSHLTSHCKHHEGRSPLVQGCRFRVQPNSYQIVGVYLMSAEILSTYTFTKSYCGLKGTFWTSLWILITPEALSLTLLSSHPTLLSPHLKQQYSEANKLLCPVCACNTQRGLHLPEDRKLPEGRVMCPQPHWGPQVGHCPFSHPWGGDHGGMWENPTSINLLRGKYKHNI